MIAAKPIPKEIGRANTQDVRVVWNDGHVSVYVARDLRMKCPCALCIEETSGVQVLTDESVPDDVHPLAITLVGRYAISINWSDGHSTGIYTFENLRRLCRCAACSSR
ncbi:MAG: DUF971 domain-containing protein [Acidobacteriota bacterium]